MFLGLMFWVFYLKWDWALIAIFVIPFALIPVSTVGRKLRHLGRRGQEIIADINSTMLESFSGIKIVRAFGLEKIEEKKLDKHNQDFLENMRKNVKYTELTSPLMEVLGVLGGIRCSLVWGFPGPERGSDPGNLLRIYIGDVHDVRSHAGLVFKTVYGRSNRY